MNRLNKLLLSFVLPIFCLLINVSHAFPDLYYYNNYLTGISPYYYTGSPDGSNIYYYPNMLMEENQKTGFVISFDETYMSGANPPSAVPLIDVNRTIGKVFELPAGHTFILHCTDTSYERLLYISDTDLYYNKLGFSHPASNNATKDCVVSDSSEVLSPLKKGSDWRTYFNSADAFYLNNINKPSNNIIAGILGGSSNAGDGASYSMVTQFFNTSDHSIYFTISPELQNFDNLELYDVDSISYDNYSSIYLTYSFDEQTNYMFNIPHIKGTIDLYYPNFNRTFSTGVSLYFLNVWNNVNTSFFLTNNDTNCALGVDSAGNYCATTLNIAFFEPQSEYIPYFLNTSIWQLGKQAIWIKNGYIAINNYDELISKLEQSGIGQSDLTRVIELLDEINTGGQTGEEVKELIGILEAYHQQLQNQANFGSATGIFDTYKNILEFSSDMHWLITANNALFEYFTGFIMMCAMFLFLSRLMR